MMSKKKIFVNQDRVRENKRNSNTDLQVFGLKNGKVTTYGNHVEIKDLKGRVIATVVYKPEQPLNSGQGFWIEVGDTEVTVR